jgi:hypothetical protein
MPAWHIFYLTSHAYVYDSRTSMYTPYTLVDNMLVVCCLYPYHRNDMCNVPFYPFCKSKISPYIMPINATQPRDVSPTTCSACIIASLVVSVTTIAESAMHFINITLIALKLDATIGGHSNLCIV